MTNLEKAFENLSNWWVEQFLRIARDHHDGVFSIGDDIIIKTGDNLIIKDKNNYSYFFITTSKAKIQKEFLKSDRRNPPLEIGAKLGFRKLELD